MRRCCAIRNLHALSEFDLEVYRAVVPKNHYLRKVEQVVPWDDFHELLAPYYYPDKGRPAELPVLMLKLEYLRYHHNLSDREVIERARPIWPFVIFCVIPWGGGCPTRVRCTTNLKDR